MKEYFHIDLSTKFSKKGTTGIACLRLPSKIHKGCAINNRVKRYIEKNLFSHIESRKEYAKLYAICIYCMIKDNISEIDRLVICNDEDFYSVRRFLELLLNGHTINIISIDEFRRQFSRKVQSPADNYAKHYSKRGLNPNKWQRGTKLNVLELTYDLIREKYNELKSK